MRLEPPFIVSVKVVGNEVLKRLLGQETYFWGNNNFLGKATANRRGSNPTDQISLTSNTWLAKIDGCYWLHVKERPNDCLDQFVGRRRDD